MPVIAAGKGIVTHINVFTTAPEKQQLLVDSLTETVKAARSVKGCSPPASIAATTAPASSTTCSTKAATPRKPC